MLGGAVESLQVESRLESKWEGADVELKKRAENRGFSIVRKQEQGLVHKWHPKLCTSDFVDPSYLSMCHDARDTYYGSPFVGMIRSYNEKYFDHLVLMPKGPKRPYVAGTTWAANEYRIFTKEDAKDKIPAVGDLVSYWYDHQYGYQLARIIGKRGETTPTELNLNFLVDDTVQWNDYDPRRFNYHSTSSFENCTDSVHPDSPAAKEPVATVACRRVYYKTPPEAAFEKAGKLIVGVLSSAKNKVRRNVIRETWANREEGGIFFMVSGPWEEVEEEYREHQDLIWVEGEEDFLLITYKTAMFVKIVNTMASALELKYTHVLKTDDDSYVATERLTNLLAEREDVDYWGACQTHSKPYRDPKHKYYVSEEEYSGAYFPIYCQGAGFVLSRAMVECASTQMEKTKYLSMEDVFTGILAERCGIFPSQAPKGEMKIYRGNSRTDEKVRPATMKNKFLQHHIVSDKDMKDHHDAMIKETNTNIQKEKIIEHHIEGHKTARKIGLEFVHITKTGGSAIEKAGSQNGIIWGACHFMDTVPEVGCFGKPDIEWEDPPYFSYVLTSPWHTPPKNFKQSKLTSPYAGSDLFTVVRNPYARFVSEYYCPWQGFNGKYRKKREHGDRNDPNVMNDWIQRSLRNMEGEWAKFQRHSKLEDEDRVAYIIAQKHFINQVEYVYEDYESRKTIVPMENVVHYENMQVEFSALMKRYRLDIALPAHSHTLTDKTKKLSFLDLSRETIQVINRYAAADFEAFGYEMVDSFDDGEEYSLKPTLQRTTDNH